MIARRLRKPFAIGAAFLISSALAVGPGGVAGAFGRPSLAPAPTPAIGYLPASHGIRIETPKARAVVLHVVNAHAKITLSDGTVLGNDPAYQIVQARFTDLCLDFTKVYQPAPTDPLPDPPYTLRLDHGGTCDGGTGFEIGPGINGEMWLHIANATACLDALAAAVPSLAAIFNALKLLVPACLPATLALPPIPLLFPGGASLFDLLQGITIPLPLVLSTLHADLWALNIKNPQAGAGNNALQDPLKVPLTRIKICNGGTPPENCAPPS